MHKKMSKQVSKWIHLEKNKCVFHFPSFGPTRFCKFPWSHTSTPRQRLAAWGLTLLLVPAQPAQHHGHGGLCCPHPVTWQGPGPALGRQCSAWTAAPLVADSPQALRSGGPPPGPQAGAEGGALVSSKHQACAKHLPGHGVCWIAQLRTRGYTQWELGFLRDRGQVREPLWVSVSLLPGSVGRDPVIGSPASH